MSVKAKFEEKIRKKKEEIQEYETKIREAKSYLQALEDAIKLLPRETNNGTETSTFRPGSNIAKTYELLKKKGAPMHINDILSGIGKTASKKEKVSMSGALGWYVRRKEIFTRPFPNTFGLFSMEEHEEPPDEFGIDEESEGKAANGPPF
jgi:hypothetical protein